MRSKEQEPGRFEFVGTMGIGSRWRLGRGEDGAGVHFGLSIRTEVPLHVYGIGWPRRTGPNGTNTVNQDAAKGGPGVTGGA